MNHAKSEYKASLLDLSRCCRLACDPAKIGMAFLGLAMLTVVGLVVTALVVYIRQFQGGEASGRVISAILAGDFASAFSRAVDAFRMTASDARVELRHIRECFCTSDLLQAVGYATVLRKTLAWGLLGLMPMWMVWAFFAGAINRGAAYEYATRERLTAGELRRFAGERYSSYFWAPIALGVLIAAFILIPWVLGIVAAHFLAALCFFAGIFLMLYLFVVVGQKTENRTAGLAVALVFLVITVALTWSLWDVRVASVSKVLAILLVPVAVALAFAALLSCLVLIFGRGLMRSSVSFEATDAFDAIVRGSDYVLRRPLYLLFALIVGGVQFVLCFSVMLALLAGAFLLATVGIWGGLGEMFNSTYGFLFTTRMDAAPGDMVAAYLLLAVIVTISYLALAWAVAYVQSFWAVLYALLRKQVDLCDITDIFIETSQTTPPTGQHT